jgi:hypothetical protein
MDALLSINHGQRPAIYFDTVETVEPTDACEIQKTKFMVSLPLPLLQITDDAVYARSQITRA